jgi:hypothetical protein
MRAHGDPAMLRLAESTEWCCHLISLDSMVRVPFQRANSGVRSRQDAQVAECSNIFHIPSNWPVNSPSNRVVIQ